MWSNGQFDGCIIGVCCRATKRNVCPRFPEILPSFFEKEFPRGQNRELAAIKSPLGNLWSPALNGGGRGRGGLYF